MRGTLLPVVVGFMGAVGGAMLRPGPRHAHSRPRSATMPPCVESAEEEFTLAITVNSTYVSLTAVDNGTDLLVLRADEQSVYPGTPAYSVQNADTGTGYNTSLVLDLANSTTPPAGHYGISVPDLGARYGATANVVAQRDYNDFGFQIDEDAIYHSVTFASQSWFACLDSVNGTQGYFLKWGVFTASGDVPDGCLATNVVQVFNVAQGACLRSFAAAGWPRHR